MSAIAPIADIPSICEDATMRVLISLTVATLALASCASKVVQLSADRCWSLSAGDRVEGTAILYLASPFTFHVGPKLSGGPHCPDYAISFANKAVSSAYAEITKKRMSDDLEGRPTEKTVALSGQVLPQSQREGLTIDIKQLRLRPMQTPKQPVRFPPQRSTFERDPTEAFANAQ
jgi:hypothetical protein